jgi:hypothetical protein
MRSDGTFRTEFKETSSPKAVLLATVVDKSSDAITQQPKPPMNPSTPTQAFPLIEVPSVTPVLTPTPPTPITPPTPPNVVTTTSTTTVVTQPLAPTPTPTRKPTTTLAPNQMSQPYEKQSYVATAYLEELKTKFMRTKCNTVSSLLNIHQRLADILDKMEHFDPQDKTTKVLAVQQLVEKLKIDVFGQAGREFT